MRLLLDTHAIVWWFSGNQRLPSKARQAIADSSNDKFVSAASAWEIATKYRLGKIPSVAALANDFRNRVAGDGFDELPTTVQHALRAGSLPGPTSRPVRPTSDRAGNIKRSSVSFKRNRVRPLRCPAALVKRQRHSTKPDASPDGTQ